MNRALPHLPENPILNRIAHVLVASLLSVTMLGVLAIRAGADDLDDRREQLDSQIEAQKSVVEGASKELTDAVSALDAAKTELAAAETALADAENNLTAAKELDTQRASELQAAETKAKKAKADVAAAQAAYDSVDARTSEEITVITQQNGGLAELSVLFTDIGTGNMNQRAQLADTLFSSSALELDELTSRRFQLDAAKKEADAAEASAAEARKAAAEQLETSKAAEEAAKAKRAEVAEKVSQRDAAKEKADSQLTAEKGRQSELESESNDVDRRIQERIAQQKREEEERRARESSSQQSGPTLRPIRTRALLPAAVSSARWTAPSALPTACVSTPFWATANCTMAPILRPVAGRRFVLPVTVWCPNGTSMPGTETAS